LYTKVCSVELDGWFLCTFCPHTSSWLTRQRGKAKKWKKEPVRKEGRQTHPNEENCCSLQENGWQICSTEKGNDRGEQEEKQEVKK